VAALRSNRAIHVRGFYADPLGAAFAERLIPTAKIALPGDSAWVVSGRDSSAEPEALRQISMLSG